MLTYCPENVKILFSLLQAMVYIITKHRIYDATCIN